MKLHVNLVLLASTVFILTGCNTGRSDKGKGNGKPDTVALSMDTVIEIQQPQTSEEGGIKYKTYNNNTYNYSVDYPVDLLIPQGESGSGDGQVFKSKDEKCTLWVYRDFRDNVSDSSYTIETAYKEDAQPDHPDHPKREITYKTSGKNFYVISGTEGNKVFYQKTIMKKEQLITCLLEYKKSEKTKYDPVTEHISRSFR